MPPAKTKLHFYDTPHCRKVNFMTGRRKNSALIIRLVFSFRCPDCKIRGLRFPGKNRIGRGIFQKRYQFLKFKCAHRLKHFCTVGRRLCVKPAADFSQSDAALFLHCLNGGLHCKTGIPERLLNRFAVPAEKRISYITEKRFFRLLHFFKGRKIRFCRRRCKNLLFYQFGNMLTARWNFLGNDGTPAVCKRRLNGGIVRIFIGITVIRVCFIKRLCFNLLFRFAFVSKYFSFLLLMGNAYKRKCLCKGFYRFSESKRITENSLSKTVPLYSNCKRRSLNFTGERSP